MRLTWKEGMINRAGGAVNQLAGFWRLPTRARRVCRIGLLLGVTSCHLGRPAPTSARVGQVEAAVAEPGVVEAVQAGLGDGLARRGALGGALRVDCVVVEAVVTPAAVSSKGGRVERARLAVRYALSGPRPASVVLRAERSYVVSVTDALATERARAAAFAALARQLGAEAAAWVAVQPRSTP